MGDDDDVVKHLPGLFKIRSAGSAGYAAREGHVGAAEIPPEARKIHLCHAAP
jgi:hypothetical protein